MLHFEERNNINILMILDCAVLILAGSTAAHQSYAITLLLSCMGERNHNNSLVKIRAGRDHSSVTTMA